MFDVQALAGLAGLAGIIVVSGEIIFIANGIEGNYTNHLNETFRDACIKYIY